MSLKSKEAKASAGGGVSLDLLELLYDENLTSDALDEFAREFDGRAVITNTLAFPSDIVMDSDKLTIMAEANEFIELVFSNVMLTSQILSLADNINSILITQAVAQLFWDSTSHQEMLNKREIMFLSGNVHYMRLAAEDTRVLTMLFADMAIRTYMWEEGGKGVADVLMRESAHALNWLTTNLLQSTQVHTSYSATISKMGYMLTQVTSGNDSSEYSYAGTFVGDYKTGTPHLGSAYRGTVTHNERVNPIYVRNYANSSSEYTTINYIAMSD